MSDKETNHKKSSLVQEQKLCVFFTTKLFPFLHTDAFFSRRYVSFTPSTQPFLSASAASVA